MVLNIIERRYFKKMGKTKMVTTLLVIFGLIVLLGLGYLIYTDKQPPQLPPSDTGSGGAVDCEDEPYIDNSTFNEYAKSTGVGVAYYYTIKGSDTPAKTLTPGTSGSVFAIGDQLTIFSTLGGYLDKVDKFTITKCGGNQFTNYISAADGGTLDILDQNYNPVTNGVTSANAVNLSDGGSTTPLNMIVRLNGVVDESTGQLYLTVEGNDTEVDDITISPLSGGAKVIDDDADILDLFSAEGTSPTIRRAFIVDEVLDGAQVDYTVKFTPETGVTMGGGAATGFVYVNVYAGQWFVDDDGTLKFGWEDSDGTVKYETQFTHHDALIS